MKVSKEQFIKDIQAIQRHIKSLRGKCFYRLMNLLLMSVVQRF